MATRTRDRAAQQAGLAEAVAASAQQIWQAGLGAFAKAQQDGGELFQALVREGADLHRLTRQAAGNGEAAAAGEPERPEQPEQPEQPIRRIEKIFEDRVSRSLRSLGVPTRDEFEALRREVEALKADAGQGPQPASKPRSRAPAKRPARAAGARP